MRIPRFAPWSGLLALSAGCASTAADHPPPRGLMRAPFAASHLSFFHSALEIPPLESAQTLVEGEAQLQLRSASADSNDSGTAEGQPQGFEGRYDQVLVTDASWGLGDGLELGGRLKIGGWAEHVDSFALLDADGSAIVFGEQELISGLGASERHLGLSDVVLHARQTLDSEPGAELAGLVSFKIPVASKRDLSNAGTYDLNVGLQRSSVAGSRSVHANLGVGAPLGDETLFVDEADVELHPWVYAGVGVNWLLREDLSWGLQLEGNTGAFGDVDFLDGTPLTALAGLRKALGGWALDFEAGTGLTEQSYDWLVGVGATR
ncbi:MAG TPA: hypothetical protein VFD43_00885, partial [Planctomycetota bacterium]|nr:hypothetical protein [Planctomycetota bacterium]